MLINYISYSLNFILILWCLIPILVRWNQRRKPFKIVLNGNNFRKGDVISIGRGTDKAKVVKATLKTQGTMEVSLRKLKT